MELDGVKVYGPPSSHGRGPLCAFSVEGIHPTDLAMVLDQYGTSFKNTSFLKYACFEKCVLFVLRYCDSVGTSLCATFASLFWSLVLCSSEFVLLQH